MASVLASAAQTAHAAVSSLLSAAQVKPGATVSSYPVKEDSPAEPVTPKFEGKTVILFVPGAFSGTCTGQVPTYIQNAAAFKEKGVKGVYVVAVNDAFAMKAWKEQLAPGGTEVKFYADDKGQLTGAFGLLFDATAFFGGPRAKRAVVILDGNTVESVAVEEDPTKVTVTDAKTILANLS
ncbi:hypothetical protein V5O48_008005 [Marasmius crinis-equi]|uniref:Thioredoxin domain-containing protein n=1 Tax=Marasmius crinis-equi TaxID=585013 RepID=A0ABR3FF16_9AGAR